MKGSKNIENRSTMRSNREEEYQRAQQAAVEAVMVGRETLETAIRQGEQLQNSENMADETEYKLDKANRILRGMTWSGWLANKLSRDVDPPTISNETMKSNINNNLLELPLPSMNEYENGNLPDLYLPTVQALRNYHANLYILRDCETEEQMDTCILICDDMHRQVLKKIGAVSNILKDDERHNTNIDDDKSFLMRLQQNLSSLRQRQMMLQRDQQQDSKFADDKSALFNSSKHVNSNRNSNGKGIMNTNTITSYNDIVTTEQEQDQHLHTMNKNLQELGALASHLNFSLTQQSDIIDSLDSKNETLHFKTNSINRRTDRFINDKSWSKIKAEFVQYAWIRYNESGRYLSVAPNNDATLVLSNILNERCVFGIWKRNRVIGMQNKYNRRWMGQNFFGQLTCSATSFNRREEWEVDHDWTDTTFLIVSAGWGNGGYLLLDKAKHPIIGGCDILVQKISPRWCVGELRE